MKSSKLILLSAFAVATFISCRKDDEVKTMAGTWEGRWGFGYDPPTYFEKWQLKKGGDLVSFYPDGQVYAEGSWDADGDEFEAHYTPLGENYTYTFTGTFDEDDDEITGIWGESTDPSNGGTFEMSRE
ncbi:MAG TPA: hypothetical protein VGK46_05385 [Saprospiraceae bacterium]